MFRHLLTAVILFTGVTIIPFVLTDRLRAEEPAKKGAPSAEQGSTAEGTGFGMFDLPSIKGFDESKVEKDPICDRNRRPKIIKVEPDEVKPGEKVMIKGENFGTKECFHGVTFSAVSGTPIKYKYVNDTTIEAIVPDAKAGMTFVVVVAGGGSAQSKAVLIKGK